MSVIGGSTVYIIYICPPTSAQISSCGLGGSDVSVYMVESLWMCQLVRRTVSIMQLYNNYAFLLRSAAGLFMREDITSAAGQKFFDQWHK